MDHRRFEAALRALRALQTGTTRRSGLSGLAAVLGVLLGGAVASGGAAGRRDGSRGGGLPHGEGPCGDGSSAANRCTKDRHCCSRLCDTKKRRCRCVQRGSACSKNRNCCNSLACTKGICRPPCNAATCPNGCCDGGAGGNGRTGGICVTAANATACGTGGAACVACSSIAPICDAGTCEAGTWTYRAQFGKPGGGSGDSYFNGPVGVFDSADTLSVWVVDRGNNRIAIWRRPDHTSTTWSYHAQFGTKGADVNSFDYPSGIHVSADTLTAWVADARNHRVSVWTRPDAASTAWSYSTYFGGHGPPDDKEYSPNSVYVSPDTLTAWVADADNNRIVLWTRPDAASKTWSYSTTFGSNGSGDDNMIYPKCVVASADTLTAWVADYRNDRIVIWTRPDASSTNWSYRAQFGVSGSGPGELDRPAGVAVSADTLTAWVANEAGGRMSVWTRPDTAATTWSNSSVFGAFGSGPGDLGVPAGVFVSANTLTAWVADQSNNRISIWTQG